MWRRRAGWRLRRVCWIVGIKGRKPRNFPPPQATGKPDRGGQASVGRPGHFHRGLSYQIPVTQKYSPLGQGPQHPEGRSTGQCTSFYKKKRALKLQGHLDVIQRRVCTEHHSSGTQASSTCGSGSPGGSSFFCQIPLFPPASRGGGEGGEGRSPPSL